VADTAAVRARPSVHCKEPAARWEPEADCATPEFVVHPVHGPTQRLDSDKLTAVEHYAVARRVLLAVVQRWGKIAVAASVALLIPRMGAHHHQLSASSVVVPLVEVGKRLP